MLTYHHEQPRGARLGRYLADSAAALVLTLTVGLPMTALATWRLPTRAAAQPVQTPLAATPAVAADPAPEGAPEEAAAGGVELEATAEVFVAVDGNRPPDGEISGHVFDSRHGELALSQALIGMRYRGVDARGAVRLWTGYTPSVIYRSEPTAAVDWSLVREASAGARIGETAWLEAGLLPSPIGFEGAHARDNWLWSAALLNAATPFYLMGARLQWAASRRTTLEVGVYGGWNRLRASNVPSTLLARAFGERSWGRWQLLVTTAPTRPEFSLAGTGKVRGWMVDGWLAMPLGAGYELAVQANGGAEVWLSAATQRLASWGAVNVWGRKTLDERWRLAVRAGIFGQGGDHEVVRGHALGRLFWPTSRVAEVAAAVEYRVASQLMLRAEGRLDHAADAVFVHADGLAFKRPTVSLGAIWDL